MYFRCQLVTFQVNDFIANVARCTMTIDNYIRVPHSHTHRNNSYSQLNFLAMINELYSRDIQFSAEEITHSNFTIQLQFYCLLTGCDHQGARTMHVPMFLQIEGFRVRTLIAALFFYCVKYQCLFLRVGEVGSGCTIRWESRHWYFFFVFIS
jgi:hypothetical protein